MPLSATSICGFFFFEGLLFLFVCFCLQCSIWECNPRHCSFWASSLPLRYIPKAFRFVFWNSKHPSNQIYTEEGQITKDETSKKLLSFTHSNSHEGLSWAGYFYRVVSNDLGKIRKSEDSRKKIGFGLENCLNNRAIYLEGHYLRAIRSQEENQESIVSHWGDSGQD